MPGAPVQLRHLRRFGLLPPEMVPQQIGGDPEEVVLPMVVVFSLESGTEHPKIGFLKQVIRQREVAADLSLPTRQALSRCRFESPTKDGEPVYARYKISIPFTL